MTEDQKSVTVDEDYLNFQCRYRAFLRACLAEDLTPKEAMLEMGYKVNSARTLLKRLRERHSFEISFYKKLGKVLNVEPTMLFYANQQSTPLDSPAHQFARQVEKLINENSIPYLDPETNLPTDVVSFVWQMGHAELDNIRLTFKEQREAFLLLRDTFLAVIERPLKPGQRKLQNGKMEIGHTLKDDILADIDAREKIGEATFDRLESQFCRNEFFHFERILEILPDRMRTYNDAVSDDEQNVDEFGRYSIDAASIRRVLDADFHVRKVIFPTPQQDETFRLYYKRSRSMIDFMLQRRVELLSHWWPEARDANTRDLKDFNKAWNSKPPRWAAMKAALRRTLDRTKDMVDEVYKDFTLR